MTIGKMGGAYRWAKVFLEVDDDEGGSEGFGHGCGGGGGERKGLMVEDRNRKIVGGGVLS